MCQLVGSRCGSVLSRLAVLADPAKDSSTSDHQLAMLLQQQEEEEHQQREAARRQQPGQQSGQPGQAPAAQPAPSEPPQTAGRGSHPAPGPSQIHQRCAHLSLPETSGNARMSHLSVWSWRDKTKTAAVCGFSRNARPLSLEA